MSNTVGEPALLRAGLLTLIQPMADTDSSALLGIALAVRASTLQGVVLLWAASSITLTALHGPLYSSPWSPLALWLAIVVVRPGWRDAAMMHANCQNYGAIIMPAFAATRSMTSGFHYRAGSAPPLPYRLCTTTTMQAPRHHHLVHIVLVMFLP